MSASFAETALADYHRLLRRRVTLLVLLTIAAGVSLCVDLVVGPSGLTIADAVRSLLTPASADPTARVIVWEIRLPAAMMALLVGAALSLAGAEMQTTLNNPLASPFTLGMSSAAIFGAALAIVLQLGIPGVPADFVIPVNAFVFAFASVLVLQQVGRSSERGADVLVLFGIALFFTFNALVAILQFVASEQALQQLVFWTMGSLGRATWTTVAVVAAVLVSVMPFSLRASWQMTALRLGDERAQSFGIDVARLRWLSLLRISVLTAAAVAFVGTIAFVGLVGPHLARMVIGEDHRFFLPASALSGAVLLSLSSAASKIVVPGVLLPIGLVTALIGVPFFVSLLLRRRTAL
jgi:iron complex transport system permease protein